MNTASMPVVARPVVTIIGAGVTGLTAAHELVERGFAVQVVDKCGDPRKHDAVGVGGIAATQWGRLPVLSCKDEGIESGGSTQPWINLVSSGAIQAQTDPTDQAGSFNLDYEGAADADLTRYANQLLVAARLWRPAAANRAHVDIFVQVRQTPLGRARQPCLDLGELATQLALKLAERLEQRVKDGAAKGDVVPHVKVAPAIEAGAEPDLTYTKVEQIEIAERGYNRKILLLPQLGGRIGDSHGVDFCDLPGELIYSLIDGSRRVPGEHGYRFFPSFYRHLFDTMQRTPLIGLDGQESGQTVMNNLVATQMQGVGLKNQGVARVPRRPVRSAEELRAFLATTKGQLQFLDSDVAWLELKTLQFMTACHARRAAWARPGIGHEGTYWEFLGGDVPDRYSPAFRKHIKVSSQGLLAMKEDEIDAHTYGNISVQLMIDQLQDSGRTDMLLNGPTSEAWLDPWKRYLKRQGVRFFRGELDTNNNGLTPGSTPYTAWRDPTVESTDPPEETVELEPNWQVAPDKDEDGVHTYNRYDACDGEDGADFSPTYYVLATPLDRVWQHLPAATDTAAARLHGAMKHLYDWRQAHASAYLPTEDAQTAGARVGPFRHFPGIQFYLGADLKYTPGHTYYVDSTWGLSSVSQPQFWRVKISEDFGFRGLLSVDIGNVYDGGANRAWDLSKDQIAAEVWRQAVTEIFDTSGAGLGINLADLIPGYLAYHLDDYYTAADGGTPARNAAPFLINLPVDWERRSPPPSTEPVAHTLMGRISGSSLEPEPGTPIEYRLCHHRWVVAGPHQRTATRMTTMEAANESARRAVNAILYHQAVFAKPSGTVIAPPFTGFDPIPRALMGDLCEIWDPEDHELPDLRWLKRVDAELFKMGKPHLFEILQLDQRLTAGHSASAVIEAVARGQAASLRGILGAPQQQLLRDLLRAIGLPV
jgi:hypothetical protein